MWPACGAASRQRSGRALDDPSTSRCLAYFLECRMLVVRQLVDGKHTRTHAYTLCRAMKEASSFDCGLHQIYIYKKQSYD